MAGRDLLVFAALTTMTLALLQQNAVGNSDSDALDALRRSLTDPDDVLASWDTSLVNPCTWFHITCNQDERVTRVDLGNKNLSGHIAPELEKLEYLQYLELYENNIEGGIPAELGNLKNLISLDLFKNKISGTIPESLGNLKSLVFLRLNDNQLQGTVPESIFGIPTLKVFDFSNNNLSGRVPSSGSKHVPLINFEHNPQPEGPNRR